MPAKAKSPHKKRRLRTNKKAVKPEEGNFIAEIKYTINKYRTPQPKVKKAYSRRVHPAPMELGTQHPHPACLDREFVFLKPFFRGGGGASGPVGEIVGWTVPALAPSSLRAPQ